MDRAYLARGDTWKLKPFQPTRLAPLDIHQKGE